MISTRISKQINNKNNSNKKKEKRIIIISQTNTCCLTRTSALIFKIYLMFHDVVSKFIIMKQLILSKQILRFLNFFKYFKRYKKFHFDLYTLLLNIHFKTFLWLKNFREMRPRN